MAGETHVCRKCGHVGEPNWVHWESAFDMDGGYTPRCNKCNAITYTKKEWLKQDYSEKSTPLFMGYFVGGALVCAGTLLFDEDLYLSIVPFWFTGLILVVIFGAMGERRFVKLHEDE